MQVQSVNSTNFKGLQCHPNYSKVEYVIATKTGWNGFDKATKLMEKLAKNEARADIFLGGDLEKPKIYAEINGKIIKESWLFGPISVLKKALKLANKLEK